MMYLCVFRVRQIDFASFYDISIGIWNCVVFLVFILIHQKIRTTKMPIWKKKKKKGGGVVFTLILEYELIYPAVTVYCRISIQPVFLYFNVCRLSVILDNHK